MRTRHSLLCFALACASLFADSFASAQTVSDADKAAARELYIQGVQLQQGGRFAEALDKLQRAQAVFNAPTNLLHIAECQAALGKLVESTETYRALLRFQLPANPSAAFVAAQHQGAAELPQVESRVSSLKIEVTPPNLGQLSVTIDDQPMSSALVGVARPINPGSHRVAASASGYQRAEETVSLRERDNRTIVLALKQAAAPIPPPPVYAPTAPAPTAAPAPVPTPVPYQPSNAQGERESNVALLLGLRAGALFPGGNLIKRSDGSSVAFSDAAEAGGGVALEAGVRIRKIYIGISLEGAAFKGATNGVTPKDGSSITNAAHSGMLSLHGAYISNPSGVGFYGELGGAFRALNVTSRLEESGTSSYVEAKSSYTGGEFQMGVGIYIKASPSLIFIPKLSANIGQFTELKEECSSNGSVTCSSLQTVGSNTSPATHSLIFAGIGGYLDI